MSGTAVNDINVNGVGDVGNDCLPADPLLQSGTYIDGDSNMTVETTAERDPVDVSDPTPATESLPCAVEVSAPSPAAESVTPQRRQNRSIEAMTERPSWLPEKWKIELKVRTSGATAGSVDRYYFEPVSGRKFRSKNEVLYFLETGKRKKGSTDSAATSPETPKSKKQKKGGSETKKNTSFFFDSGNPPESVCWVLTDSSADIWAPSCNGAMVQERRKHEWDAVYSSVSKLRPRNV